MSHTIRHPEEGESPAYFKRYISKVPEMDFQQLLPQSGDTILQFLKGLPADKWDYRYAPGKWTIKELVVHLIDTERIMAYRALRISRGDKTLLPGFEENEYVPFSKAADRSPASILAEYEAVRNASTHLFSNFDDSHLNQVGNVSGNGFTPRALGFVIIGHERHHLEVLKERYL
jgi:DinB superfamily